MKDKTVTADDSTTEEDLALEELVAGKASPEETQNEKASETDESADEEALAPEELVSGEGDSTASEEQDEEDLALEELVGGEKVTGGDSEEGAVSDINGSADEEVLAPEELVSGQGESAVEQQEEDDEEILALETPAETETAEKKQLHKARKAQKKKKSKKTAPNKDTEDLETLDGAGLSNEEKDDLEKLITGLKQEQSASGSPEAIENLQKQLKIMHKRVVQLGKMVLKYDSKLKSCYEVMRLYHKKSEIMNKRIDAIAAAVKGKK